MKNSLFGLLALLTLFVFASCGNDDDNPTINNQFTYNGTTYELASGFLDDFGSNGNGTFDHDVTLTSTGITYDATSSSFTGTGDFIYLDLNTDSADGLVAGTYNWSSSRETFTIVDATLALDFNIDTSTGTFLNPTGGTVEIAIDGTQTTVTFNLSLAGGETVSGNFRGVLRDI